ncbi:fasciclin domain-containing protein [Candidatus Cyanaurora vandensis]|uniref:fasciclin domain-containing protein n=1 Tax=Candidatus Cyanaurora vandensis TaxID=2714958 RepID=UPI00257FF46E|nr:fasciclin domain-containing protein [Candidatus Cyanaurora vandensis]
MANIVETAVQAGTFKTLAQALTAAGLVETLQGNGPFTVFAPTDAAFQNLPAGTLTDLLKPENKTKLANILKYHVVSGKVMSSDIKPGSVPTVAGESIAIQTQGQQVMVNEARVTQADIAADNGVIHVIDKVLLPKG